jgi:hypothetical protein
VISTATAARQCAIAEHHESEASVNLQLAHPNPAYGKVSLIEPAPLGYLHIGAEVRPPARPGPVVPSRERSQLVGGLKVLGRQVERVDGVRKVTVYEAIAFAPPSSYVRQRTGLLQPARFDVAVLVETESPGMIGAVRESTDGQTLVEYLTENSRRVHALAAGNIKRVGDVDKSRPGTFLFNYFVGDDPEVVVELWDYLAGWYQVETGLNNSTLLAPLDGEPSEFVVINHARWDGSLLSVIFKQLGKKSFRSYVLGNLDDHHVGAMPILYRLG